MSAAGRANHQHLSEADQSTNDSAHPSFKILIISSLRYPIAQPFAGGLEAHTWSLAEGLRARGHSVVVAGATGSDPAVVSHIFGELPTAGSDERADTTETPQVKAAERAAFSALMGDLGDGLLGSFDLVHNNSLYSLPVEWADTLPCPMITTLHTPPLPWADRVYATTPHRDDHFVAVSESTARSWHPTLHPLVVRNGIDTETWRPGPGGADAVWSGRIVAEKGPHLAIDIAKAAGLGLVLAGPIVDHRYFEQQVAPRLGGRIRYAGHLTRPQLVELVGTSGVALVTPTWNEPFGMVVAEAMSCGTPVVAFARGGIPEFLDSRSGRLLAPADPDGLSEEARSAAAVAVSEAIGLDRADVRRQAMVRCGEVAMLQGYEQVYRDAVARWDLR